MRRSLAQRLPRALAFWLALGLSLAGASAAAGAATPVSVFPVPGSRATLPRTQIVFRGVTPDAIGSVQVVGSKTGSHPGRLVADSDGRGASFLPNSPFTSGETVTVSTHLPILGASNGSFQFTIIRGWGTVQPEKLPYVPAGRNGVQHFHSRPDLRPPAVTVTRRRVSSSVGDIFVAPQFGPTQNGPMLLDPWGHIVWFKPLAKNSLATDFRVQQLFGKPVLTWWQGGMNHGSGRGDGVIDDTSYHQIATVKSADGLQGADLHEFLVTPDGRAYIIGFSPVHWGKFRRPLMDGVVQEIDIRTGLVLFEWHALDHVPLSESFYKDGHQPGHVLDPYHLNAVALDRDGNLILSMRNTWALYKINHQSGAVMWTLGSNRSSFKLGGGVRVAFQHNPTVEPDGTITIFDDGAGPPRVHSQSRVVRVALDMTKMTATLVKEYLHSPRLVANFEGGAQSLSNGDIFAGWGQQPYFSEFDSHGKLDFDAHFNAFTASYRAYRFPWNAQPATLPALAVRGGGHGSRTVYASWNGATTVVYWRVLGGSSPDAIAPLTTARKHGFESAIQIHGSDRYIALQALDGSHTTLSSSRTIDTAH